MNEYNDGDLVEAAKGPTIIRSLIVNADSDAAIGNWALVKWFEDEGFTLTVIEKAAPKNVLPTETGWYLDRYHRAFHFNSSTDLYWWGDSQPIEHVDRLIAPFTRLEPAPVTAKKALDQIRASMYLEPNGQRPNGTFSIKARAVADIESEFGVSS